MSEQAAHWVELLVVVALSLAVAWSFAPRGSALEQALPTAMFVR